MVEGSAWQLSAIEANRRSAKRSCDGFGDATPDGDGLFGYTANPRVYFERKTDRDGKMERDVLSERFK
jgi:hypothetical protein